MAECFHQAPLIHTRLLFYISDSSFYQTPHLRIPRRQSKTLPTRLHLNKKEERNKKMKKVKVMYNSQLTPLIRQSLLDDYQIFINHEPILALSRFQTSTTRTKEEIHIYCPAKKNNEKPYKAPSRTSPSLTTTCPSSCGLPPAVIVNLSSSPVGLLILTSFSPVWAFRSTI